MLPGRMMDRMAREKRSVGPGPMGIAEAAPGPKLGPMDIGPMAAKAGGPPNLRESSGEEGSCADCRSYEAGKCVKFGGAAVAPTEVCDGFEEAGEEMGDMASDPYEMEA